MGSLIDYLNIEINSKEDPDVYVKIENAFKKQRKVVNDEIIKEIGHLKEVKKLNEMHVAILTMRQRMLEDSHILMDKLVDLKREYKMHRAEAYNVVLTNMQLRIKTTGEKEAVIEGNDTVSESKARISLLENQILFYSETIKTIDQVLYGLKTRLDVEKLLGG